MKSTTRGIQRVQCLYIFCAGYVTQNLSSNCSFGTFHCFLNTQFFGPLFQKLCFSSWYNKPRQLRTYLNQLRNGILLKNENDMSVKQTYGKRWKVFLSIYKMVLYQKMDKRFWTTLVIHSFRMMLWLTLTCQRMSSCSCANTHKTRRCSFASRIRLERNTARP